MECKCYSHAIVLVQHCHWGWGRSSGFGDLIRSIPCDCTHCHHQFLDCNEKIWNLTPALFDTDLNYSIPNRVLSKLKNTWKSIICLLIHLSSRHSQALMLRSFILCLNVSMVRNPTEISGILSTERNLFCNSFLNVIPNPCCLHTFSFSMPINDIFFMLANALWHYTAVIILEANVTEQPFLLTSPFSGYKEAVSDSSLTSLRF